MSRIVEPLGEGLSRVWELSEVLVDTRTPYQHLVIARTSQGVALFCDDDRQSTEDSQLVYHEALLVPALLLAARLDRILIIGSSEGVVSQIAAAAGASHVDHVDIDRDAVRLCAQHLPYGYSPADLHRAEAHDGPIHVHYTDGLDFVATSSNRFDVIVIDLPDEHPGPAQHGAHSDPLPGARPHLRLYQADFLFQCRGLLTPNGVVATQAGCPTLWRNHTLLDAWRRFHQVFPTVTYYGSDEHEWSFLFGQAVPAPPIVERLATLPYTPASIDAEGLRGRTIPPHSLRAATSRGRG